jgi:hypothetical protein
MSGWMSAAARPRFSEIMRLTAPTCKPKRTGVGRIGASHQLFLDGRSRAADFLDGRFQFVQRHAEFLRPIPDFVVFTRVDAAAVPVRLFSWYRRTSASSLFPQASQERLDHTEAIRCSDDAVF